MNASSSSPSRPSSAPDLTESVAGEEDPGASLDMPNPANSSPVDQAPAGSPGTGEDVCPKCGGSGKLGAGSCPHCQGTGKVTVGVGGA